MSDRYYISFEWAMRNRLRQRENFVMLEGFLSTVMGKEIKIVELLESIKDDEEYNPRRLDLLVKDKDGEKFLIEVQWENEQLYFQWTLFETSPYLKDYLADPANSLDVKGIYCISVITFDMRHGEDYLYYGNNILSGVHYQDILNIYPFKRDSLEVAQSRLNPEFIVLKVNGFNEKAETPLQQWIEYFKNNKISDDATAPGLREVRERLKLENMNSNEENAYERHQIDLTMLKDHMYTARGEGLLEAIRKIKTTVNKDYDSAFNEAYDEAYKKAYDKAYKEAYDEAFEEGQQEVRIEVAKNMKSYGEEISLISKVTGLTPKFIENL